MSDPTQPPRDPEEPAGQPPPEQPPTNPFPESSLGSSSQEEPPPEREWGAPVPPTGGGLTSGDPLGGAVPAPAPVPPPSAAPAAPPAGPSAPQAFPPGYSSPAPPGAGGAVPAYGAPAPGTYQLGSWWARVGAFIIDALIVGVPAIIIFAILGLGAAGTDGDGGTAAFIGGLLLTLVVFLLVALFYAPVMMSRTNGQTVGRMATGIRVIRANGEPMTFGFAALREIAVKGLLIGTVGSVTFGIVSLLDYLWPLWDDENRALHDMVVNTRTVKA